MPEIGFQRVAGRAAQSCEMQRPALHLVVVERRRAVGIDHADRCGAERRFAERCADCERESVARARRSRYVVRVVGDAASRHGDARGRKLSIGREQHRAAGFAQRQPVARRVVGAAERGTYRFEGVESADDEIAQQVESRDEDMVVLAAADQPRRDDDGRHARNAGVRDHQRPVRRPEMPSDDLRRVVQVAFRRIAVQQADVAFGRGEQDERPFVRGRYARSGDHLAERQQRQSFRGRVFRHCPLRCQLRKPFRVDPADGCAVVPCREIRPPGAHGLHILPRAESER